MAPGSKGYRNLAKSGQRAAFDRQRQKGAIARLSKDTLFAPQPTRRKGREVREQRADREGPLGQRSTNAEASSPAGGDREEGSGGSPQPPQRSS